MSFRRRVARPCAAGQREYRWSSEASTEPAEAAGGGRRRSIRWGHEGGPHGQRLPPPGRARLRRPHRHRRRTRPAGRILGVAHLPGSGGPGPGPGRRARRARASAGRAGGHRQPELGPAAHQLLGRARLGAHPRARSTSASTPTRSRYIVEHSGARRAARRPRARRRPVGGEGRAPVRARRRRRRGAATASTSSPGRGRPTRTPPPPSTTRAARRPGPRACSSPTATCWLNATIFGWHLGVTDRDVYLHTLPMFHCNGWGMPFAVTGMGGPPHRAAQGRRRRDPAAGRRPRRHACCAARRRWRRRARRRRHLGRPGPGARHRTAWSVAGAPPPTRTIERIETELGWEFVQIYGLTETAPILTMARGRAEWDDLSSARAGGQAGPGRRAGARRRRRDDGRRRGAGPRQRRDGRATGTSPRPPPRPSATAGSTPATAAPSTTSTTSTSPTASRT